MHQIKVSQNIIVGASALHIYIIYISDLKAANFLFNTCTNTHTYTHTHKHTHAQTHTHAHTHTNTHTRTHTHTHTQTCTRTRTHTHIHTHTHTHVCARTHTHTHRYCAELKRAKEHVDIQDSFSIIQDDPIEFPQPILDASITPNSSDYQVYFCYRGYNHTLDKLLKIQKH